ncbi:MAG: DNA repair exonuclease [Planctomycetales bacterium]|nr:DNA repair exonuclease [Planctomycetales bacterium]
MKFLHAADIHLDSPLRGLERYEGAPVEKIRLASRLALENLVALAIEQKVDLVLLAGDTFDGDGKDWNTALFFTKQMGRLVEAQIPVLMISGNHDALSKMTRSVQLPRNVTLLGTKKSDTHRLEEHQVAIHGQSFQNASVPENMVSGYPAAVKGWFNIGMLHTSLDMDGGEHACYAPCKLSDLEERGYDYWALGHIHQRHNRGNSPCIAYPGNIQGRHIRETGAKGCLLVTIDNSSKVSTDFQPLDVFRWEQCLVDATDAADGDELLLRFQKQAAGLSEQHESMPLGLRVTFRGRCAAHGELCRAPERWTNQVRAAVADISSDNIWVEKVRIETASPSLRETADDGPLGELAQLMTEVCGSDEQLRELEQELADLRAKLPLELREGPSAIPLDDPAWLRQLVQEAEPMLVGRLTKEDAE